MGHMLENKRITATFGEAPHEYDEVVTFLEFATGPNSVYAVVLTDVGDVKVVHLERVRYPHCM